MGDDPLKMLGQAIRLIRSDRRWATQRCPSCIFGCSNLRVPDWRRPRINRRTFQTDDGSRRERVRYLLWHLCKPRRRAYGSGPRTCLYSGKGCFMQLSVYSKPRKLLKIRNPWGELEWKGGASDRDKKFWNSISASEKRQLGYEDKNDGLFFMFWE